jgi:hypothetical protein
MSKKPELGTDPLARVKLSGNEEGGGKMSPV